MHPGGGGTDQLREGRPDPVPYGTGQQTNRLHICLKKWYTVSGSSALHETVGETGRVLEPKLAGIGSVWPDWQYITANQAIYISEPHMV